MASCPHGDPTCPCQDGDACHYEGPDPMTCPHPPPGPPGLATSPHCHVEGCRWNVTDEDGCGLVKLGLDPTTSHRPLCGALRFVDACDFDSLAPEQRERAWRAVGRAWTPRQTR